MPITRTRTANRFLWAAQVLAGALGLLIPAITRIRTGLAPLASGAPSRRAVRAA